MTHRTLLGPKLPHRFVPILLAGLMAILLFGCVPHMAPKETSEFPGIVPFEQEREQRVDFASAAEIEALSADLSKEYLIGPGDVLSLDVWNRPEVSVPQLVVGPDGNVTIPRVGSVVVQGLTRTEAADSIRELLSELYSVAEVTLTITAYRNNKAYILGRVRSPGIIHFPGQGSLIEAISLAGGVPSVGSNQSTYQTQCAIIRGNDQIFWIDLDDLLNNGNMALNATIQPNDVIFVPEAKQALIYVMGEVFRPGALSLSKGMTFWDALMLSGGPTEDANLEKTFLVRWDGSKSHVREINLQNAIVSGNLSKNYVLQDNDIIFVAERGVARWNYYIRQITPTLRVMSLSRSTLDNLELLNQ